MKKVWLFCIALIVSVVVFSQDKINSKSFFSAGIETSLPLSFFGEIYSAGVGASAQENLLIAKKTYFTLYIGYINYFLKKTYGGGSDGYIPLLAGIRQDLLKRFFVAFQTGVSLRTHELGTTFTYSPGVGIKFTKKLSTLFKYTAQVKSSINSGAIELRVAYILVNRSFIVKY